MGSNNGTGQPYWFCCSKCRKARPYRPTSADLARGSIARVELTGKRKEMMRGGGARVCRYAWQYKCLDCGHVGWSRHVDIGHKAGYSKREDRKTKE